MNDEHAAQIVRAIREHTRAMACATLMLADRIRNESPYLAAHVKERLADADWILAALSASSGGENDAASGEDVASGVFTRSQNVSGHREPAVASEVNPSETQAATPPLSADAAGIDDVIAVHGFVTVRRDDLAWVVAVLSIHGECTTRWNRLRDVVYR